MDPDEALRVIRASAAEVMFIMTMTSAQSCEQAIRLAEHVVALDEWLAGGGFLPAAWQSSKPCTSLTS
jgi:hypothetical protein